jgi:hypothetical protein
VRALALDLARLVGALHDGDQHMRKRAARVRIPAAAVNPEIP